MKGKILIIDAICYLFVLLFVYTSFGKLLAFDEFRADIGRNFHALNPYKSFVAAAVCFLEIFIAIMLLIPRFRRVGLVLSTSLMLFFTLYVARILRFSDRPACTCGGVIREMSWTQHFYFNIFFVLIGVIGLILYLRVNRRLSLE